jgi:hypothetical protein
VKIRLTILILFVFVYGCNDRQVDIRQYDVVWDSPGMNASGSMPLGNGEVGINVWAERSGDIFCYLATTDAWNENGSLVKTGLVRIRLTPNPFDEEMLFEQRLDLENGEIRIRAGHTGTSIATSIWVDANHPAVHFSFQGDHDFEIRADLMRWRKRKRELRGKEVHTAYGIVRSPDPIYEYPDSILESRMNEIVWCHQNRSSIWSETLRRQGMASWMEKSEDPLLYNTYGGMVKGPGLISVNDSSLVSGRPGRENRVDIYLNTGRSRNIDDWNALLHEQVETIEQTGLNKAKDAHDSWWHAFWSRSWICPDGSPQARTVARSAVLQRFISACAGRGRFPQKFNGSLFTMDSVLAEYPYNADFRQWGGPYWLQNTRLIYWPMLMNGDYDMMRPLFGMYMNALPYAKAATQRFYGHDGAFFPETMYFWGSYVLDNFGWNTPLSPFRYVESNYIRYYFQGSLEVTALMLDYFRHTQDEEFAKQTLIPFALEVIRFYDAHYTDPESGRIRIQPSQALETYWDAVNPTPPVAGLQWNINGLLDMPASLFTENERKFLKETAEKCPNLPKGERNGAMTFTPAEQFSGPPKNHENPEFYAIFPYRLTGVGKPDLDLMRNSYNMARVKLANGWAHYDVNAAFLGLTDDAKDMLVNRATPQNPHCRFPAFWGPNWDWIPDQDHGSNILIALQAMLLQTDGDRLMLFPAWPREWDVRFRIHAPKRTTLDGELRDGRLVSLEVNPASRRGDVEVLLSEQEKGSSEQ